MLHVFNVSKSVVMMPELVKVRLRKITVGDQQGAVALLRELLYLGIDDALLLGLGELDDLAFSRVI